MMCAGSLVVAGAAWMFWKPTASTLSAPSIAAPTSHALPAQTSKAAELRTVPPNRGATTPPVDAQAIKATFEASRDCYFVRNHAYAAKSVINACLTLPETPETATQRAACSNSIEMNRASFDKLFDAAEACPRETATAKFFYEATKAAAAQGNTDAQACYVQSLYQSEGVGLIYSQQDIDDYRRDAPGYIAGGLSRGDWRIVALLARGGHGDEYSPLGLVTKDDIYTQYVMNRLLQLGADGAYAAQQDRLIEASYLAPRLTQGPALTEEQIARGNKDALDLFHRSFDRQAPLKDTPIACTGNPSLR